MGLVIGLSVVAIWAETDNEDLLVWEMLDNVFLVIFIVELSVRLWRHGARRLYSGYETGKYEAKDRVLALFDTLVVFVGMFDLWAAPFFLDRPTRHVLKLVTLLRLARLVKLSPMLMNLASALGTISIELFWLLSVMFAIFFVCGLPLVHFLGHGEAYASDELDDADAYIKEAYTATIKHFESVPTTLFTLFRVTTIDDWNKIADPMVLLDTRWRFFFVFFIAFMSWTMLSVLKAIASEKMIDATFDRKEKELQQQEHRHKAFLEFLKDCFRDADLDGNDRLDKDEFQALMRKDFVLERMRELGVHLSQEELFKAWEMLDVGDEGQLTSMEFVDGLKYYQEGLSTRHVVSADYSLKRASRRFEEKMKNIREATDELKQQTLEIVQKLSRNDNADADLNAALTCWQTFMAANEVTKVEIRSEASSPSPR